MRCEMVLVFPLPAPAIIARGPFSDVAASCCDSSSAARISLGDCTALIHIPSAWRGDKALLAANKLTFAGGTTCLDISRASSRRCPR